MASSKVEEFRLMVLGKSGSGKSSLANAIMGEDLFGVAHGIAAGTVRSVGKTSTKPKKGIQFSIVDTPGFFDPTRSNEEIKEDIIRAVTFLEPGLHAVLYVLKPDRYTPEEKNSFMQLKKVFDENVVKYTIIVFTRGDEMKKNKITLEQMIKDLQPDDPFKQVLDECGGRVLAFSNKDKGSSRDKQVKALLDQVRMIKRENGEIPYKCEVQEIVNVNLKRAATQRFQGRLKTDSTLKKMFEDMAEQVRRAKEDADKETDELDQTIMQTTIVRKKIKEEEEAKEKERQEREAKEKEEKERKEREEREREEREKREAEEKRQKEEAEEEKKRKAAEEMERKRKEDEERKKREEEERERKRKEEEQQKKMEELQEQMKNLEIEQKMREKMEKEKKKMQEEYEKKLEEARRKEEEEDKRRLKEDVDKGKETHWVQDVAGGAWKGVKGWFGW